MKSVVLCSRKELTTEDKKGAYLQKGRVEYVMKESLVKMPKIKILRVSDKIYTAKFASCMGEDSISEAWNRLQKRVRERYTGKSHLHEELSGIERTKQTKNLNKNLKR